MQTHTENTKRIAKNTLMLYGRMLFSMVVSLYTSRVVLGALGVEDYGIYNVVGGIVAMLDFLNGSMSGATSRFMTYELGRGELNRQKDTFASAMIIHVGIALFVLFFAETIGLWFLENKLVIPDNRMVAARVPCILPESQNRKYVLAASASGLPWVTWDQSIIYGPFSAMMILLGSKSP